jgi:hypothetical protein
MAKSPLAASSALQVALESQARTTVLMPRLLQAANVDDGCKSIPITKKLLSEGGPTAMTSVSVAAESTRSEASASAVA